MSSNIFSGAKPNVMLCEAMFMYFYNVYVISIDR